MSHNLISRELDHLIIPKDIKLGYDNDFILMWSGEYEVVNTLDTCIPESGHEIHKNTRPELLSEVCWGSSSLKI